jgi:hypothetical protein
MPVYTYDAHGHGRSGPFDGAVGRALVRSHTHLVDDLLDFVAQVGNAHWHDTGLYGHGTASWCMSTARPCCAERRWAAPVPRVSRVCLTRVSRVCLTRSTWSQRSGRSWRR